jgi:uncharacterized metal-binding protein YceD (DUF177 family)
MEKVNDSIKVPLRGLPNGSHTFEYQADGEFFQTFGSEIIHDAVCDIWMVVTKSRDFIKLDCTIIGSVIVECDRCLDDLQIPIEVNRGLLVKFGSEEEDADVGTGDDDVMMVDDTAAMLDLSQFVYDYVCLALPLQMVHPEGECNPMMTAYLSKETGCEASVESNMPFSGLKDLLDNKNN